MQPSASYFIQLKAYSPLRLHHKAFYSSSTFFIDWQHSFCPFTVTVIVNLSYYSRLRSRSFIFNSYINKIFSLFLTKLQKTKAQIIKKNTEVTALPLILETASINLLTEALLYHQQHLLLH